jgi:hypothetical protein
MSDDKPFAAVHVKSDQGHAVLTIDDVVMDRSDDIIHQTILRRWARLINEKHDATIAGLRAENADLKARPALPWQAAPDYPDQLPLGRYLIHGEFEGKKQILVGDYLGENCLQVGSKVYGFGYACHYIPWADLTPPGREDAR